MNAVCVAMMLLAISGWNGEDPERTKLSGVVPFAAEFAELKAEFDKSSDVQHSEFMKAYAAAKTPAEREAAQRGVFEAAREMGPPFAVKAMELVRPHATDPAAVEVLIWIVQYCFSPEASEEAAGLLIQHHLTHPETQEAAERQTHAWEPWAERILRALSAAELPRERKARVLFRLAEMLQHKSEQHAGLQGLEAEKLKQINSVKGEDWIKQLQSTSAEQIEAESAALFTRVVEDYPDVPSRSTGTLADRARGSLYEIQHLKIGKVIPEIEGEDIDGETFKLSDYRGKVVVLSFWAFW